MSVRRLLQLIVAAISVLAALTGCASHPAERPRAVPAALVPKSLFGGSLHLYRNIAPDTLAAFRRDNTDSLIFDGQLWEIRRADRLIGTLEIATVKPDVDLTRRKVRDQFTTPILVGAQSDIRLRGQEVSVVIGDDGVSTLVWFGRGLFQVLQVKDSVLTGPKLAEAVIAYQQSRPEWVPLPQLYTPA